MKRWMLLGCCLLLLSGCSHTYLERQVYPGLKVLNLVFEDARIPYCIRSKQPGKTKYASRESYWTIEKRNGAKEAEHPLQDAPTLTDSQDTSGGSCSPSSGTPAG